MRRAVELSAQGVKENKGGPFGCVIANGDQKWLIVSTWKQL